MNSTLIAAASLFAQQKKAGADDADALGALACCGLPFLIIGGLSVAIMIAIMWKVFTKAGQPGWAALVPFYNQWILVTEIAKKEPLWFILMLVPIANIVASWVICMEVAKKFGKSETFGIGLFFLGPICWGILAFGDARYEGRGAKKKLKSRDYDDEEDEDEEEDDAPPPPKKRRPRDDDDE